MPAANQPSETPEAGNRAARRARAKAAGQPDRELGRSSTKGGRSKPAAQPKNYAFRRA
ncbi:hypothetical protein AB0J74_13965 [Asanoa sp. NPDC049573]|uniref:hypothetical protein n=1 Tax=Asanoa sp. NPDC049573 TaxID=3155396 RepID=UPI00343C7FD4